MSEPTRPLRGPSRRQFLTSTARAACGAGVAGLALGLYAGRGDALPATKLRPPGAAAEPKFLGACVRCGLCVRACPYPTLSLSEFGEDAAVGTPYFVARDAPCEMCDDIPCVAACPTNALDDDLADIDDARMGLAILSDQEACLNFQGLRCDVCYRVCPLIDEAISLERRHNERTGLHALFLPTVNADACTGCGKCEHACVLEEAAIRVLPRKLIEGAGGSHYQFGWKADQAEAGK